MLAGRQREAIDRVLHDAVRQGDVPGVVAAVTDRAGTVYEAAFGERRLGDGPPMTVDSVFYVASMAKPITAVCAMRLCEQGRLELDAPLSRYVPDVGRLRVLDGWDEHGQPRLRPPRREITLRDLHTHSAGFAYDLWDADLDRYLRATGSPADAELDLPLTADPGTRWRYGVASDWLGRLVELASGQPLDAYMCDHVLAPLGMDSTGYRLSAGMAGRRVALHRREPDGGLVAADAGEPGPPRVSGGGGLYSSAGDYQRFMRMILNRGSLDGRRILRPETVAEMCRNQLGDLRVTRLTTTDPSWSADVEFFPGLPKGWGLGFMVNQEPAPTGRPAGSLGWAGLRNTYFWIDPTGGIGGVYMAQLLPFADPRTLAGFYGFETAVYHAMG